MKKYLVILLLVLGDVCYAEECSIPQVFYRIEQQAKMNLPADATFSDYYIKMLDAVNNGYTWSEGWSQKTIIQSDKPCKKYDIEPMTIKEEAIYGASVRQQLYDALFHAYQLHKNKPVFNEKINL